MESDAAWRYRAMQHLRCPLCYEPIGSRAQSGARKSLARRSCHSLNSNALQRSNQLKSSSAKKQNCL